MRAVFDLRTETIDVINGEVGWSKILTLAQKFLTDNVRITNIYTTLDTGDIL